MYQASNMILKTHSYSLYLNSQGAWSWVGRHHYLRNDATKKPEIYNRTLINTTGILKMVIPSSVELEFGGLFINTKKPSILQTP